nr:hypothetical protein [Tanacetum cinerariifolium]
MHNNIMAACSRDRPPMLAPGRYPQWQKEAIHLILTEIGDDIYSTVDACQTAQEIWEAIERLQQGESLNFQDMKTNLFWEFSKFTSHDGESMESYYTRFYKLMNKMIRNNLALIAKYFKKIYKPTNNNLRTSSNSKNKNVDTTPREKVGSQVVHKSRIQCFNCKEYGHFAKECRKPKWLRTPPNTDEEVDEQELEAHYGYMAKIQEVPNADSATDSESVEQVQNDAGYNVFANRLHHSEESESVSNTYLVETDDINVTPDSLDMCEDDIQKEQNDVESDDERVTLANLISNLKLDVDENKKIQKQLKKANTTLAQELNECKAILAETSMSMGEFISVRDSFLVAVQTKQIEFEKFKAFNDRIVDYDKLKRKLNDALGQLAHKDTVIREGLKTKAYKLSVVKEKHDELMKQSLLTKSHYEGLVKQKTKVKEKQEKDKIRTKPHKIKIKREAWKSSAMSKSSYSQESRKREENTNLRDQVWKTLKVVLYSRNNKD